MSKRFVIANQKGGVGKTTTAVNLAAALARLGQRTLLVDLDPQGNATMGSGIDKRELPHSVYDVLIGAADVDTATRPAVSGGHFVLPANRELAGAELELVDLERRETRLLDALSSVEDRYEYVLIDCPPSLSLLTLNGFCAAQGAIIPMQCEYYALEGLSDLVNTIRKIRANFNHSLEITGLLRVMFDTRATLSQQVSAQLEQHFGDKVFRTVIPRNVRLAEAPSYGMPGVVFDPLSKGAKAYLEFGAELLVRIGRPDGQADDAPVPELGDAGGATHRERAAASSPDDAVPALGSPQRSRHDRSPTPPDDEPPPLGRLPEARRGATGISRNEEGDMPSLLGSRSTTSELQE